MSRISLREGRTVSEFIPGTRCFHCGLEMSAFECSGREGLTHLLCGLHYVAFCESMIPKIIKWEALKETVSTVQNEVGEECL